uniref:Major facilitator superfamily (MFS) profile domain-containing protein n=1 Tax=Setaria digitata TaxID=48799 RepID=A0A915PBZ0_9BILA
MNPLLWTVILTPKLQNHCSSQQYHYWFTSLVTLAVSSGTKSLNLIILAAYLRDIEILGACLLEKEFLEYRRGGNFKFKLEIVRISEEKDKQRERKEEFGCGKPEVHQPLEWKYCSSVYLLGKSMNDQLDTVRNETCDLVHGTKQESFITDQAAEVPILSVTNMLDPEKLLNAFGKYGKYQMRTYILLTIPALFYSSQVLIMGFITHPPPFQCIINYPNNSLSLAVIAIKMVIFIFQQQTYRVLDNCHVLELKTDKVMQCSAVPDAMYVYREEVAFSTINSEFDLVCEDEYWAEHGSSLFMLGGLFTPVITQLSDLFGRRKLFLMTSWSAGIAAVACSMTPTFLSFLVCRIILGVATTGVHAIIWIMCCESVAVEFRSLVPVAFTITWVFGIMLVGVLRIWILNWRRLYFIISIPSILSVFYYWFLPESPYWLISHGKQHAIEQYIKAACDYNKVQIDVSKCESDLKRPQDQCESRTIMDILRSRVALFHLIVQCYVMAAMNISYWGMALLSITLSEDNYTGYFLSGLIELPGGLIAVLLLLKFGRRSISMWSFFAQSLLQFMAVFFPSAGIMQMTLAVIAKFFNSFVWVAQPLMLAEMSPTTVRNTFYGTVQFFAEIGSIVAPYLPLLKNISPRAPQAVIAAFSVTAALLLLTAPETKDRSMPEDLDQFDPGCFLRLLGYRKERKRTIMLITEDVNEASTVISDTFTGTISEVT